MFPLIRTLDFLQDGAANLPDQHLPDANLGVGLGAVEQRAVGAVDLHEGLHEQRHPELGVARERQGTTGGTDRKQIVEMERWLLSALRWEVQPVTTFEVVRLLLPFTFCEREHRAQLAKYCEHITLAQALVYPLLKYEPTVLAVTSIVCAAYLVSSVFDEHLNAGLAALVGAPLERTWQCRRDVQTHVNLSQLQQLLSR